MNDLTRDRRQEVQLEHLGPKALYLSILNTLGFTEGIAAL